MSEGEAKLRVLGSGQPGCRKKGSSAVLFAGYTMMPSRTNMFLIPIMLGGLVCFITPLASFAETSSSWTPPIGIPAPSFGISEIAPSTPSPWTSPTPGFYYVCTTCSGATDASNPYGTPSLPRKSIPLSIPAGAVVELHGAIYRDCRGICGYTSPNVITANGTAASPVFIRGASTADKPKIVAGWEVQGSYFVVENLEFADADGDLAGGATGKITMKAPTDHGVLRYSDVHGNLQSGGVGIASYNSSTITNVVIYKNFIHDNGDVNASYDQDVHCIGVGNNVNTLWVVDNELARCSGDGIQINSGSAANTFNTHHIYIGRNVAHHNKQTGFWSKQATDVIISQNTVYGIRPSPSSSGGGGLGYQYGPERVWFLYNHVYDTSTGVGSGSRSGQDAPGPGKDIYIIGNVLHNIHRPGGVGSRIWDMGAALLLTDEQATKHVINNTIYDTDAGIRYPRGVGPLLISNNIFRNVAAEHVAIETRTAATASSIDGALFDGPARIRWSGSAQYDLTGFTRAFPTQCVRNCLETDPRFVNASANDFHLQVGSPVVDAGAASDAYATFQNLYGLNIAMDYDRVPRPQGRAWDIGAYEFTETATPPPPPEPLPPSVPVPIPTVSLAAVPSSITGGESSALSWFSTHATTCSASASPPDSHWSGSKALTGSQPVSPAVTTTYSLTCTGAGGTKTEGMRVTVIPVNGPPVLRPILAQTVLEGQYLAFWVTATDVDGDPLTLSATNLPRGAQFWLVNGSRKTLASTLARGYFTWSPDYTQVGPYTVRFSVTDGTATVTQDVSITVVDKPQDRPPVANAGPDQSVLKSTKVTLNGAASSDPDGDPIWYYRWTKTSGPASGFTSAWGKRVPFTPTLAGTYTYQLVVYTLVRDPARGYWKWVLSAPDSVTVTVR